MSIQERSEKVSKLLLFTQRSNQGNYQQSIEEKNLTNHTST